MKKLTKRQQEIIQIAIDLIASGGIQNLTIKNISERLGVSEPAIYRHFKSKLDILSVILDTFEADFDKTIAEIEREEVTSFIKLKKFFIKKSHEFANNPNLARVIFSEEIFQNEKVLSAKVVDIMRKNGIYIQSLLKIAQDNSEIRNDTPIEHLSTFIFGTLRLLVTRWRLSEFTFDLPDMAQKHWNSIEKMIIKEN